MNALPDGVERDYPLARLTTIRTGGDAELFARPGTIEELERLLAWAGGAEIEVGVVGSGSNLLVADEGVRGLVLKLDHELSEIELDGTRINCGGGARLPSVSAQAARAGLTGIEFGVNIPGTVGGAVRMNANAYGGELARALDWVDVVSAARNRAASAGSARLRLPPVRPGPRRGRGAGVVRAQQGRKRGRQAHAGRHAAPAQGGAAIGDQDVRLDRSRIRPIRAPRAAAPASCWRRPAVAGCASAAPDSRISTRTSSRTTADATTADVVAVMAEGRRRVRERFGDRARARGAGAGARGVARRVGADRDRARRIEATSRMRRPAAGRSPSCAPERCCAGRPRVIAALAVGGRDPRRVPSSGCGTPRWSPSSGSASSARRGPDARPDPLGADARRPQHDHARRQHRAARGPLSQPYPVVKSARASAPSFRTGCGSAWSSRSRSPSSSKAGRRIAVAGDGTLLHDVVADVDAAGDHALGSRPAGRG